MKKVNSDVAYEYIRKRILGGEFPPGHPLLTEVLSAETGVSRTPVREALHRLSADGLVSIQPRLGASVKRMDAKEFREMCDLRLALEGHAAGLAALNRTAEDVREIGLAYEAMRKLTDRIESSGEARALMAALSREDVRFHIAVMSAAKNDLMKGEILRLHLVNRIVGGPARPAAGLTSRPGIKARRDANRRHVLASHHEILKAITRGDAVAAKRAMEGHIQEIIEKILLTLAKAGAGGTSRELTEAELAYSG